MNVRHAIPCPATPPCTTFELQVRLNDSFKSDLAWWRLFLATWEGSAIWGWGWRGSTVLCRCDNSAVVGVLRTRTCKEKEVMHLLRCLHFYEASLECRVVGKHLPGTLNDRADDLSRNRLYSFLQKLQKPADTNSSPSCTLRPSALEKPDWQSLEWKQLFRASLRVH